ncbi:MAG: PilC/PilY family type IV pilus protein [Lautropia sp.]|nr:PilC/PilY family type IV pilus protein [Lautropia sp.]
MISSRQFRATAMFTHSPGWRVVAAAAFLMSCATLSGQAHAAMAQQSLIVKDPGIIEPNIMYTIDDSGSMAYNHLPDSELPDQSFVFHPKEPRAGDYVWYIQGVLATNDSNLLGARRRAPAVNKAYYNPEVRYLPWVDAKGNNMPNANPKQAIFHVGHPRFGNTYVNLEGEVELNGEGVCISWRADFDNRAGLCPVDRSVTKIKPATYYEFDWPGKHASPPTEPTEADKMEIGNYKRVSIADAASFVRGEKRDDCAQKSGKGYICTQAEEYQNFANWYQFHRTRMHIAIAASGRAFSGQPEHLRIGYGRINKLDRTDVDGGRHAVVERGVRRFAGAEREQFLTWLNGVKAEGYTPLVNAMLEVGRYYKRTDALGPWSNAPGKGSKGKDLSCRRSYHVIMTDGKYNFRDPVRKEDYDLESDSRRGPSITDKTGTRTYEYVPQNPYQSPARGTLADYAMDLWKNDLHPGLDNNVPTDAGNPAFWQHVSTYTMSFGLSSGLNPDTDLNALKTGAKQWPNPVELWSNDPIDDLWHAAVNSRGEYVNVQEGTGFLSRIEQILGDIVGKMGNTAGLAVSSHSLQAGNVKFVPSFVTREWTGNVTAYDMGPDGKQHNELWSAANMMPPVASRNLYAGTGLTAGGSQKSVALQWGSLRDDAKNEMLTQAGLAAADGPGLVNWMRGDQSRESVFRRRRVGQIIGHIVNSSPVYVGAAIDRGYRFLPETFGAGRADSGRGSYRAYVNAKKAGASRPGLVFVGSNSGVLHAFDGKTGKEVYGFVPRAVLGEMARSSRKDFQQRFLMDGPLVERDAFWDGKWNNVLVGTTGAGPRAVFALNVQDTRESALNANTVLWELNASSQPELGHVLSAPEVGVLRDGTWVAVFGNGYESQSGEARLFVVNLKTGEVMANLNAGKGKGTAPNGLGGVTLVKDGMQVITAAYAGDLKGNVWKFDLASADRSKWQVGLGRKALFTTKDERPITAAPTTVAHPGGGVMVLVGTGKLFEEGDEKTTDMQSVYGLWDKDMLKVDGQGNHFWEGGTSILDNQIQSHRSSLIRRGAFATIVASPMNWTTMRGWHLEQNMMGIRGQRLIAAPQMVTGLVLFETMNPVLSKEDADDICLTRVVAPAFNLLLDPLTGAMPTGKVFDTNRDRRLDGGDDAIGGWKVNGWTGRSVVLTEAPAAPCTTGPCASATQQQPLQKICPAGWLTNSLLSANGNEDVCVKIPPASRWWWREMDAMKQKP